MPEQRHLLILLHRPGFEAIHQAASIALTAGSCGDHVTVAPFYGGLLTLLGKLSYDDEPAAVRARAFSLPDPRHMLREGRHAAGVRLVACESAIRLAGLAVEDVRPIFDEILGFAGLWRGCTGAQILYI